MNLKFEEKKPDSDKHILEEWVYSKNRCLKLDKDINQLRDELNSYRFNYNKGLEESLKKQECLINQLKTNKNNLIKAINQNKTEMENLSKQLEELKDRVKDKDIEIDRYKDNFEDIRSQNQKLMKELENEKLKANCVETESQNLKKEIQSLRQERKHLEDNNSYYKQKILAVSHTAITQHELYANSVRKVAVNDINIANELSEELVDKINDILKEFPKIFKRKIIEELAETVANVDEVMQQINKKQRKMEQKTDDGKVHCGSCEKTFFSSIDLKYHMTVKHNMNTTDLNKNMPEIIEID